MRKKIHSSRCFEKLNPPILFVSRTNKKSSRWSVTFLDCSRTVSRRPACQARPPRSRRYSIFDSELRHLISASQEKNDAARFIRFACAVRFDPEKDNKNEQLHCSENSLRWDSKMRRCDFHRWFVKAKSFISRGCEASVTRYKGISIVTNDRLNKNEINKIK